VNADWNEAEKLLTVYDPDRTPTTFQQVRAGIETILTSGPPFPLEITRTGGQSRFTASGHPGRNTREEERLYVEFTPPKAEPPDIREFRRV
jgi:hypothetical protein